MKHLTAILILAVLTLLRPAAAQPPNFALGVLRLGLPIDDRSVGCKKGYTPGVNNGTLLNSKIQSPSQQLPLNFPGGVWGFTKTIVSDRTSRVFAGNGIARIDGGDGFDSTNGIASKLVLFNSATVTFDGATIAATAASGSNIITVNGGYTVSTDDLYQTLYIAGGTGFSTGYYQIEAVSVGTNQLTLDRACASATASAMTGYLKRTLWRDKGLGNIFSGLNFLGTSTFSGTPTENTRAAILFHIQPNLTGSDTNSHKGVIEKCTFGNAEVGILCGEGLAKWNLVGAEYEGQDALHADHVTVRDCSFQGVKTAYLVRNLQSVHHILEGIHIHNTVEEIIRVDRGGMLWARDIHATNGGQTVGPTLVRLGGASAIGTANTVFGPISVDGFELDAPSTTFKLLTMDDLGDSNGDVRIANGNIQKPLQGSPTRSYYDVVTPVATVKDGWCLTLRNVRPLYPGWVKLDNADGGNFSPCVRIEGCVLEGPSGNPTAILDNPQLVLDATNLAGTNGSGCEVIFINNIGAGYQSARRACRSGVYRIGTNGSGTWVTSGTGFSDARPIRRDPAETQLYAAIGLLPPRDLGIAPNMASPISATQPLAGSGTRTAVPVSFHHN